MKKQQREKEQQERLAQKEKDKELRQKDIENDIANAGALAVVSSNAEVVDTGAKVSKMVMSDGEQAKAAAAAAADAAAANAAVESRQAKAAAVAEAAATILAERSSREKAPALLDEALVRKLFHLLDRSEENAISKGCARRSQEACSRACSVRSACRQYRRWRRRPSSQNQCDPGCLRS